MTTVSAIIPTYNYARFLRDAIDSVLAQTFPVLEVIVVDDGSTDDTRQVLEAYGDRIRVIHQENAGVAAARMTGVSAARGEYLAFLDSDDIWLPQKLEKQIARFEQDPALGLVHCGAEMFDNSSGGTLSIDLNGMEGWVARELLLLDRGIVGGGSALMVPKRVAEEVGGFDSRLSPSEDWDFSYRVATRYRVAFVPEVLIRYRLHGGGGHLNIPRMEKGMMLALEKAFANDDPAIQSMRRITYGRIHRTLSACYFERRDLREFMRHMLASLRYDPRNAAYFAAYPLRLVRRTLRAGD